MHLIIGRAEQPLLGEDAILQNDELRLYGVFDGLGGHGSGEVAAQTARDAIETFFQTNHNFITNETAVEVMKEAIASTREALEQAVARLAVSKSMATTASILHFFDGQAAGELQIVTGHVGDSRMYHLSRLTSGWLTQLTQDESTKHGLTNALSAHSAVCDQARLVELRSLQYDRFVICTDGVYGWEEWPLSRQFNEALHTPDVQTAAENLIKVNSKQDDKSVLVIDYQ